MRSAGGTRKFAAEVSANRPAEPKAIQRLPRSKMFHANPVSEIIITQSGTCAQSMNR